MNVDELPARPLLKPWYRVGQDGSRTVLQYGDSALVFEGGATRRLVPALLALLDGRRTVAEITSHLGEPATPVVERVLAELTRRDVLVEGPALPAGTTPAHARTAELLAAHGPRGTTPSAVFDRLGHVELAVLGRGAVAEELTRLLGLSGPSRLERLPWLEGPALAEAVDLVIAAPDPSELGRLEGLNTLALERGRTWLQVLPFDGEHGAVGPLFVPGETCCYRCYRIRRAASSGLAEESALLESAEADYPVAPALTAILAGLAALAVLRWVVFRDPALPGTLLALERGTAPELVQHVVYRVPRCPACSGLEGAAAPLPWHEGGGDADG
jgi:bacteriocin biosynthesis cyclodehydratase domain-containing protein